MVPKAGFEPKSAKKKKVRKLRVYGLFLLVGVTGLEDEDMLISSLRIFSIAEDTHKAFGISKSLWQ